MSCNCNHKTDSQFKCHCDDVTFPLNIQIGAGLTDLPRQTAGFPEFRRAMLKALRTKDIDGKVKEALQDWQGRQNNDLGVMLLEMWAYLCDSLSFYDKVISQEEYIRTSQRRPSLRKLVALLGYLPQPAVGSQVYLSAVADGRLLLKIPRGTAFRSSGFDGNPPQTFEVDDDTNIHPLTNKWRLKNPLPPSISTAGENIFLVPSNTNIDPDDAILLYDGTKAGHSQALQVKATQPYTGADGKLYKEITLAEPTSLPKYYRLADLSAFVPSRTARLWTLKENNSDPSISSDFFTIVLDGIQSIKTNDFVIVSRNSEYRWFRVVNASEVTRKVSGGEKIRINNIDIDTPGVTTRVTRLMLDAELNNGKRKKSSAADWTESIREELVIHFELKSAIKLFNKPKSTLSPMDELVLADKAERSVEGFTSSQFFLTDKNIQGVKVGGELNYDTQSIRLNLQETWAPELTAPVDAFGNVLKASRGETVRNEIMGSGDAGSANQTFKLKNKPLTYFAAPTVADDKGVQNTLKVFVNGIRWKEVPGFFNRKEDEEVYIVRQDDNGDSFVTFGDGIRGRRLPSGVDNIIAEYRHGAGQAAPPAGSVTQISTPVTGLSSVNNPLIASGGADAETFDSLRSEAPKSILTLGRIVSIADVRAVALTVPGVRSVQVEWRWHGEQQCPVIQVWYIGEAAVRKAIKERIRSLAEPSLLIQVTAATGQTASMHIEVEIDPRYEGSSIIRELIDLFMNSKTGVIIPENLGIGLPVFRSKLFAAALSADGVTAVRSIQWGLEPFLKFAETPGAGNYFDFEKGGFTIGITH